MPAEVGKAARRPSQEAAIAGSRQAIPCMKSSTGVSGLSPFARRFTLRKQGSTTPANLMPINRSEAHLLCNGDLVAPTWTAVRPASGIPRRQSVRPDTDTQPRRPHPEVGELLPVATHESSGSGSPHGLQNLFSNLVAVSCCDLRPYKYRRRDLNPHVLTDTGF